MMRGGNRHGPRYDCPVDYGFALFDTEIGRCGIVWGRRGIAGVQLPEAREAETRTRVLQRYQGAREAHPPPEVQRTIDGIAALLRGEPGDLSGAVLDMDALPPFHRRVYNVARTIPPGAVVSYGELAAECGAPGAARAVGQALGRNPFALVVPCHRVLAANRRAGGFSAHGGVALKLHLLSLEGVQVQRAPVPATGPAVHAPAESDLRVPESPGSGASGASIKF